MGRDGAHRGRGGIGDAQVTGNAQVTTNADVAGNATTYLHRWFMLRRSMFIGILA